MFSKTCEYAIRAVLYIARKSGSGAKTGIKEIASGIDGPEHFVAKILQELVRKGLVLSVKGPNGGFYLDADSLELSLADIVNAVDGDRLFNGCGLGLAYCSEKKPCPIHHEFKAIREQMKELMERTVVGTFATTHDTSLSFLKR